MLFKDNMSYLVVELPARVRKKVVTFIYISDRNVFMLIFLPFSIVLVIYIHVI